MSDYPLPVPAGQAPPFAVVSLTDHKAWVFIAAALCISMTILSLGIRAFIRYAVGFVTGPDDFMIWLSTVFAIIQTAIVIVASSKGLGEALSLISSENLRLLQKFYYGSNLFYLLSLGTSRVSTMLFLKRLTPNDHHLRYTNMLTVATGIWTLASLSTVALQCDLTTPWLLTRQQCTSGWFSRWLGVEITGAILEVIAFAMIIHALVWNLHTGYLRRFKIVFVFGVRLFILVFIGLRLASFNATTFQLDPTLSIATFVCWTQAEMNLSIVAATVPMLRAFLASLPAKFGEAAVVSFKESLQASISGNKQLRRQASSTIQLNSLRSNTSHKKRSEDFGYNRADEDGIYSCVVNTNVSGQNGSGLGTDTKSINSQGSKEMIIKKDLAWSVSYSN